MRSTLPPLPCLKDEPPAEAIPVPPFVLVGDVLVTPWPQGKALTLDQQRVVGQVKRALAAEVLWVDARDGTTRPATVSAEWLRQRRATCAAVKV